MEQILGVNPGDLSLGAWLITIAGFILYKVTGLLTKQSEADQQTTLSALDLAKVLAKNSDVTEKALTALTENDTHNKESLSKLTNIMDSVDTTLKVIDRRLVGLDQATKERTDAALVRINEAIVEPLKVQHAWFDDLREKVEALHDDREKMDFVYQYINKERAEKDAQIAAYALQIDQFRQTLEAMAKENAELRAKNAVLDTAGAMIKRMNEEIQQQPSQEAKESIVDPAVEKNEGQLDQGAKG